MKILRTFSEPAPLLADISCACECKTRQQIYCYCKKLDDCRPVLHKNQWWLKVWSKVMSTTSSLESHNIVVMMHHIHNGLRKVPYMPWLNVVEHMIGTNAYWNESQAYSSSCHNGNYNQVRMSFQAMYSKISRRAKSAVVPPIQYHLATTIHVPVYHIHTHKCTSFINGVIPRVHMKHIIHHSYVQSKLQMYLCSAKYPLMTSTVTSKHTVVIKDM